MTVWAVVVAAMPAWAAPPAGQVQLVKGEVYILDGQSKVVADTAGKRSRKVAPGAPFYVGETIVTKSDGRVKLVFVENGDKGQNELVLGSNTSLLVQRASTDPLKGGTTLDLARGEVRAKVNRKYSGQGDDTFEVKTRNAVAGVRGTIFVTRFDLKSQKSDIATVEGKVAVRSLLAGANAAFVEVKPGQFTSAGPDAAKPLAVKPLAANPELNQAVQSLDDSRPAPEEAKGGGGGSASNTGPAAPSASVAKNEDKADSPPPAPLSREPVKEEKSAAASSSDGGRAPASLGGPVVADGKKNEAAPAAGGLMRGDLGGDKRGIEPAVPKIVERIDQTVQRSSQEAQRVQQAVNNEATAEGRWLLRWPRN